MHGVVGRLLVSPQVHLYLHRPPHRQPSAPHAGQVCHFHSLQPASLPTSAPTIQDVLVSSCLKFRVPVWALPQAYTAAFLLCPQMGFPWHVCRESEL